MGARKDFWLVLLMIMLFNTSEVDGRVADVTNEENCTPHARHTTCKEASERRTRLRSENDCTRKTSQRKTRRAKELGPTSP